MNPYLKNTKFCKTSQLQNDEYGFDIKAAISQGASFLSSSASSLADQASKYYDQGVAYTSGLIASTVGSPVKTGSDGWATYFWDTTKKLITYVNPSSGQKVKVTPSASNWKYLTTSPKIKWRDSTPSAMTAQVSQAPLVPVSMDLPMSNEDPFMQEEEGFVTKATNYAKENPLVVGGAAVGVVALIAGVSLLRGSKSKYNFGTAPIGQISYSYSIEMDPKTGQWDYEVFEEMVTPQSSMSKGYFDSFASAQKQAQMQINRFNQPGNTSWKDSLTISSDGAMFDNDFIM
jgi:hypothetical protein